MNKKNKDIKYYLDLEWTYTIETHKTKGEKYFVVRVKELPDICSDGKTINEAMNYITEAMTGVFEIYMENGEEIPIPLAKTKKAFEQKIIKRITAGFAHILDKPEIHLHVTTAHKISGYIASGSFKAMENIERVNFIWDFLNQKLSSEEKHIIGSIVPLTPEELELYDD